MEPYYQDDAVTIYNADCRDVLPTLDKVDLVFTSPPYNLWGEGRSSHGGDWTALDNGYGQHKDSLPHSEYVEWQQSCIQSMWGTLTDTGAIFYQHKPFPERQHPYIPARLPTELIPNGIPLRQIIVWNRGPGVNRVPTYYTPSYEWILLLAKTDFRLSTFSVSDVWNMPPPKGEIDHPATFPIQLPKKAIGSTDAQTVLDPFMGSGTTLRAAKDLNRKAIGIEIEERYCEIAAKRMSQLVMEL